MQIIYCLSILYLRFDEDYYLTLPKVFIKVYDGTKNRYK